MGMGSLLAYEELSTFPEHPLIPKSFDKEAAKDFVNYLTPENVYLTLIAKQPG